MSDEQLFERLTRTVESNPKNILFSIVRSIDCIEDISYSEILGCMISYDAILKNFPARICVIYHRFDANFAGFVLSALKNHVKILIRRTSLTELKNFYSDFEMLEKHIPVGMIFSDLPLSGEFQVAGVDLFLKSEEVFTQPLQWDFIQFSSGSTNTPAGFALNFNALAESAEHVIDVTKISLESICLSYLTLSHIYGFVTGFVVPILSGARCFYCSTELVKDKPELLLELTAKKKITHICAIIKTFERVLEVKKDAYDLSSLFCVSIGGEKLNFESYVKVKATLTNYGMNPSGLVNSYGMSELGALTMENPLKDNAVIEHDSRKVLAVGESDYKDLIIKIFDDNHNELSDNMEGLIGISAHNIADFYFCERELHKVKKFFIAGRKYYFNGDCGFLSEGKVYITGRKDNTIIYNALKISGAFFKEFVMNELLALSLPNVDCLIFNLPNAADKIICYMNAEKIKPELLIALADRIKEKLHVNIYEFFVEPYPSTGIEKLSISKVIKMYGKHKGK